MQQEQISILATNDAAQAIQRLVIELDVLVRLGTSIKRIGEDMPTTALGAEDVLCHEVVLPQLAQGILSHAGAALSILEGLSSTTLPQQPQSPHQ
jgi:hypothetical protein